MANVLTDQEAKMVFLYGGQACYHAYALSNLGHDWFAIGEYLSMTPKEAKLCADAGYALDNPVEV